MLLILHQQLPDSLSFPSVFSGGSAAGHLNFLSAPSQPRDANALSASRQNLSVPSHGELPSSESFSDEPSLSQLEQVIQCQHRSGEITRQSGDISPRNTNFNGIRLSGTSTMSSCHHFVLFHLFSFLPETNYIKFVLFYTNYRESRHLAFRVRPLSVFDLF